MALYLDIFDQKFEQAQQQLAELVRQAGHENAPKLLLSQALDELVNALEEVHVLSEELSLQHSQLQVAQLTLAIERQQYFDLFDLAPDGYFVTDIQGVIEQINQTAATLLNRRQLLLIGKPLAALVAQTDIRRFYTVLNRLQQGEAIQNISLSLQPYQKQPIEGSFTIAPVYDSQHQLVGLRWLFRDLTPQQRAAVAFEESEAKYRAIVEDQTELICRSLADGRLTFVNQAFCQYFNCSSESLQGESFFALIAEADQDLVMREMAALNRECPVVTLELRVLLPDGQIRWQQWVHRALFDRSGDFFQFQSAGRDITAQKQAEEALQQREAQLRLVTDTLPVLLAYVNAKQQLIYANRAYEHWLAQPWAEMTERYLWEVLGPEVYQQIRVPVEQALSGEYVTFEQEVVLPNHQPFWISATLVPDQAEAKGLRGFFALVNDISDRKAIEYEKDQFISMISHELRTPLTSIHGALRLLTQGSVDPRSAEGQNLMIVADSSAQRMVGLVNDLLDLQQITLGRMPFTQGSCQVADLIQSAINTLQVLAQTHQITLATLPCTLTVWADADRIVQVLINLLSNAIKFSPPDSTVWITAGQVVDPCFPTAQAHVRLQVRDQGQGIPADKLEQIFEAFHPVDASDSRRRGGTGLGLAICRGIVEQHGGSIQVDSILGKGTTVSFTLPTLGPRLLH
jgi:PAS domain S-box-containing protein